MKSAFVMRSRNKKNKNTTKSINNFNYLLKIDFQKFSKNSLLSLLKNNFTKTFRQLILIIKKYHLDSQNKNFLKFKIK